VKQAASVKEQASKSANGSVPARYRKAQSHIVDNALSAEFQTELADWLFHKRGSFERVGPTYEADRMAFELRRPDALSAEAIAPIRKKVVETFPQALEACAVDDFDLAHVEFRTSLFHHGSVFGWHYEEFDDIEATDTVRQLAFAYYLHSTPCMFTGGEMEFLDGSNIEPKTNRLVFYNPTQPISIREVECYSAHPLHGRWSISGWLHSGPSTE